MTALGNAALYFHPGAYLTEREDLKGRHAAGEGFLRGFLSFAAIDRVHAYADTPEHGRLFATIAADPALPHHDLPRTVLGPGSWSRLGEAGAVHVPSPELDRFAWLRRRGDQRAFSITGVTHTTASREAMRLIGSLLTWPVQSWDALVCTSTCVRRTVEDLLAGHEAYLRERVGAAAGIVRPQLPVIPLGVDMARLAPPPEEAARLRREWGIRLGIADADLVVLFVGRLSFHAKAHPLPMLVGLEEAVRALRPEGTVHLVQAGYFANEGIERRFLEAETALAPTVRHHHVDGRTVEARRGIWHVADIFCSLSDNIQETFGLTPAEAMAAGLPVIASDWDGYRDTVVHGQTGFLIPTTLVPAEAGTAVAELHADGRLSYDRYLLETCMLAAVDPVATREVFEALLGSPERRAAMGAAGRRRAAERYDWRVVIRQYQELWGELAARREHETETAPRRTNPDGRTAPADPWHPNPLELFSCYASYQLGPASRLRRSRLRREAVREAARLGMVNVEGALTRGSPLASEILSRIAAVEHGLTLDAVLASLPTERRVAALRAIGWLLKIGALEARPG
ncbi:glycosyltransferase family 4 protein [Benzoatithermus flavus]|uniref:Glycosyltransferase family 4 protein n=1 Tax=Benzoatithermus flavus TaxID=3108223 RepID=A0ABU8XSG7_9PROT